MHINIYTYTYILFHLRKGLSCYALPEFKPVSEKFSKVSTLPCEMTVDLTFEKFNHVPSYTAYCIDNTQSRWKILESQHTTV